ncbi:MAG: RES family NAD+ phosphorylase [Acidobacteria bacterium]|nr:RES family NAD+ phosphorylase [Acidobacteriota bacterium]
MLRTSLIDRRDTHRLIPAQFADDGDSVLTRLTDDDQLLHGIFELDNATNDRLAAESGLLPGIDARELVFGIPAYRIINAAFCHPRPGGSRFTSSERGAWYAAYELESSQAEVAYHKRIWLEETGWDEEEVCEYIDYLADFHAEFHDIRGSKPHTTCLAPESYVASQALAAELLEAGSAGIVYPCVRHKGGTCLVCFRPVLVTNVRRGHLFTFTFPPKEGAPKIRRG